MNRNPLNPPLPGAGNHYLPTSGGSWLRVRPARAADRLPLDRFFTPAGSDPAWHPFLEARGERGAAGPEAGDRPADCFLAFDTRTGELAGTLAVARGRRADAAEAAIAVAKEWRGRGIGSALFDFASDLALERGAKRIHRTEDGGVRDTEMPVAARRETDLG